MARTFGFDVVAGRRYGGRLRLIALIDEAAVVDWILRPRGLPAEIPTPRPARAPPLRLDTPRTRPAGKMPRRCRAIPQIGVSQLIAPRWIDE
jgi:hypothetical protein